MFVSEILFFNYLWNSNLIESNDPQSIITLNNLKKRFIVGLKTCMKYITYPFLLAGGKLASICPDNGALYSSLMLAQGVISMIEGVMIFYSIGRAHEYVFFKSGLPTFQYAFVTYSLTAVFYIASLTLSGFQMTGGNALPETHSRSDRPWLSDDGWKTFKEKRFYILRRFRGFINDPSLT